MSTSSYGQAKCLLYLINLIGPASRGVYQKNNLLHDDFLIGTARGRVWTILYNAEFEQANRGCGCLGRFLFLENGTSANTKDSSGE